MSHQRRLLGVVLRCLAAAIVLASACGGTPDEEAVELEDPDSSLASPEEDRETRPGAGEAEDVPGEADSDAAVAEDDPGEADSDAAVAEDVSGAAEADGSGEAEVDPGEAPDQDEEALAEIPDDDFFAVATGAWHSCGLREGGQAECWGSNPFGQVEAPEGPFSALAGGERHTCGLRADGTVECWGNNEVGQTFAPTGLFTALSAGWGHSCGLRADGSIDCWGVNWNGRADPPGGQFSAVSAGDESTCGVRNNGLISCWGRLHDGQVPEGQFSAVAVGYLHSCAIRADGTVACWGDNQLGQTTPPEGRFSSVAVGLYHSCGLRADGAVACWGDDWVGQADAPPGRYVAIAAGQLHSCGLASTGAVVCWGRNSILGASAPTGQFTAIDAGAIHLCGLRVDGTLSCTGGGRSHPLEIPEGEFTAATAGSWYVCGLRHDGVASCWGVDINGETMVPPDRFSTIAAGDRHSCGVRIDGTVTCWGSNEYGQSDAPGGQAVDVAVGGVHSCGLRADGTVTCWGDNSHGQSDAPGGSFRAVAAGNVHSCGLRADGTVTCWGDNSHGQSDAPGGSFRAVAAGSLHSCGLRADGGVTCWGDNLYGQLDAPAVQFRAVTVNWDYSCGLLADGTVECWGLAEAVTPPAGLVIDGVVTEGSATEAESPVHRGDCRPRGVPDDNTAGFPLPAWALRAEGTLRVAVLFVDFDDLPADYPAHQEAEMGLPFMEEVLESYSYQRLDVEFVPLDRWLRAEHSHSHYLEDLLDAQAISGDIDREAVRLAAPYFDLGGIDTVMVVMPSTHLSGGVAGGWVDTGEGVEVPSLRVNAFPREGSDGGYEWGWIGAHELLHNLGLVDMYPFAPIPLFELPPGETWAHSVFGIMSLIAYYRPTAADPAPTVVVHYPDGSSRMELVEGTVASEMLAWSRWQLGWLDEHQVLCLNEPEASFGLAPVADPGRGIAMAAVPLSEHEVIVLESRRKMGLDLSYEDPRPDGGRIVTPALLTEGVLVYTVDASILSGDMPIRLFDDTGDFQVSGYPILAVGDQVTVRGYTIAVVADGGATHTVRITRTGG